MLDGTDLLENVVANTNLKAEIRFDKEIPKAALSHF